MGGRGAFALTLALGGAILIGIGVEIWAWFQQRDAGRNQAFPLGHKLFPYGFPPERYRSHALRVIGVGVLMVFVAVPALVLARV